VRGSACDAASWTSRSGTPASKLVESNVPAVLNTPARAGRAGLFLWFVITFPG
jgi:hypothetical protein